MNSLAPETRRNGPLRVEIIDTFEGFLAAEADWKKLEARDPEMTFFLSWDWLFHAFRDNPFKWSVLALRAPFGQDGFVGLLPLKYGVHWSTSKNQFQTEIEAGGRLLFSEYTGFLCDPTVEVAVMETFATALRRMPWSKFSLRYVAQKRRADLLCASFERHGYRVSWKEYRINNGETDNLVCPTIALPDSFDSYLQTCVSARMRQRYRRFQRRHFDNGDYHFTHGDAASFDRDVAVLMDFWKQKWAPVKGEESAGKVAANFEKVLACALKSDALFLPVLWHGDKPLAALGHVMDPSVGAMHFIIAGRDIAAEQPFIGAALHFHSIECAILLGCQTYDFGHGDEAYKFSYGAQANSLAYFSVERPDRDPAKVFDSISTGTALKRIEAFLKSGKTDEARRACRQLSRILS